MHSGANVGRNEDEISTMGKRLGNEVLEFIQSNCAGDKLEKISFVGYSLGGTIIRAALPYLHNYRPKFHGYVSLGSPHLGYLYKKGQVFNTGMWLINNLNDSPVISKLSYDDGHSIADCYMYRLSQMEGLDWFQHVLLVGSSQDEWVPYESTRMQYTVKAKSDDKRGAAYASMVSSMMRRLPVQTLYRVDINFFMKQQGALDSMLGRTAHGLLLADQEVLKMIVERYRIIFS